MLLELLEQLIHTFNELIDTFLTKCDIDCIGAYKT